jgi:hypothetical protein
MTALAGHLAREHTQGMTEPVPWYSKHWRATELGRRSTIATCAYLMVALAQFVLASTTESTRYRLAWAAAGSIQLFLGLTLLATMLRLRRRRLQRLEAGAP